LDAYPDAPAFCGHRFSELHRMNAAKILSRFRERSASAAVFQAVQETGKAFFSDFP